MRIGENLGQLRMSGKVPYQYDMTSARPYPYKSEDELIAEGLETDLIPPWGDVPGMQPAYLWPHYVAPPQVPSLEAEVYKIRRAENGTIYPWAGTWNDNRISTKELDKTSYPMGPPMDGLGQLVMPSLGVPSRPRLATSAATRRTSGLDRASLRSLQIEFYLPRRAA